MFDITKHKIGVFSPSSYISADTLRNGCDALEQAGIRLKVHEQASARLKGTQMAGTDTEKLNAFRDLISDPEVGAIMSSCGGNRSLSILPEIVDISVNNTPKPLIGFSDFTTILNNVNDSGIFGPMINWCAKNSELVTTEYVQSLISLIDKKNISFSMGKGNVVRHGVAHGRIYGGTHSVFQALLGTPYFPNLDNSILFLEDVGEELSRVDRLFATLKAGNHLNSICGLVCGQYLNTLDTGRPFGFDLVDIIEYYCSDLSIPIVINCNFGHGNSLTPFPIGREVSLDISQHNDVFISVL